ncbi:MAG TPA: C40 family peptidase [Candidatus Nanopelagicales bacterium]
MPLLNRARGLALAGVTTLALAAPLTPAAPAAVAHATPVAAVSVAATSTPTVAAPTSTAAADRKKRTSRSARSFAVRSARVMRVGSSLKGVPYRYGGTTPRGFDCSGFTSYVFRKIGVRLPHSATGQMHKARRISRSAAKPGDLVFFRGGRGAYHVGIYAGGNKVLHSPRPGQRVHVARIWTRNVSFGRVI